MKFLPAGQVHYAAALQIAHLMRLPPPRISSIAVKKLEIKARTITTNQAQPCKWANVKA